MGKLPKMKSRTQSEKSRSARRTSPSADSIDTKPTATEKSESGIDLSALAARQGSGITKKKKQKSLSRHQRLRKEKGIARADVVIEKMEKKVVESKKKGKKIKERAAAWEDLNGTKAAKQEPNTKAIVDMNMEVDEDEDEDEVEAEMDAENAQAIMAEAALVTPADPSTGEVRTKTVQEETDGFDAIT